MDDVSLALLLLVAEAVRMGAWGQELASEEPTVRT